MSQATVKDVPAHEFINAYAELLKRQGTVRPMTPLPLCFEPPSTAGMSTTGMSTAGMSTAGTSTAGTSTGPGAWVLSGA